MVIDYGGNYTGLSMLEVYSIIKATCQSCITSLALGYNLHEIMEDEVLYVVCFYLHTST